MKTLTYRAKDAPFIKKLMNSSKFEKALALVRARKPLPIKASSKKKRYKNFWMSKWDTRSWFRNER